MDLKKNVTEKHLWNINNSYYICEYKIKFSLKFCFAQAGFCPKRSWHFILIEIPLKCEEYNNMSEYGIYVG